ncbi:MAG TPA: amidohydrolase family protein [Verrucomicrobiae bacterium]|nr:amidohydrolase family protein [Verrucomicrobiae bacterium]
MKTALLALTFGMAAAAAEPAQSDVRTAADLWRARHLIIDLHQHIDSTTQRLARAVKVMDAAGVGIGVNLTPGTVTPGPNGAPSEFEQAKRLADTLFPGRFLEYMNLDYSEWDKPDFAERAARQVDEGYRLGAAGLKEWKRLGLYLKDGQGKLLKIDDPKLDKVWERCGELGLPVSIHVADPKAFWLPFDNKNERWKELKDHRSWWFGDTNQFPAWKDLLEALNRVIARHPRTTFVCVHFGNNAEELDWVDQSLSRYPNMMIDLAARIPEIGRHDPAQVRRFFIKHQDRILFATDFQSLDRLILGSSGNEPPPSDADAEVFFAKEWRWLETADRNWTHMTPIQGDWTISSIHLPLAVLRKIYFDNARKLLARSLPSPVLEARRISQDFELDGCLGSPLWQTAHAGVMEQTSSDATVRPSMATAVRALWSDKFLYLSYECPFTELILFSPALTDTKRVGKEGASLWDRDVVEAFIGSNPQDLRRYAEFEVAPSNEKLDLMIPHLPERDFAWNSRFESRVNVDKKARVWTCEMRIPLEALSQVRPQAGTRWPLNLYRCDRANKTFLALRPTLTDTFHTPERFAVLAFVE